MKTIKLDDYRVTYDDSQEVKEKVFNKVMEWFNEHKAYCGETIAQSDRCQLSFSELLETIADDIIKFDVEWDE